MAISAVSRRFALSGLGALAVLSAGAVRRARAQKAVRFRDIRVDVWRLRGSAGDQTADWVEEDLPKDLALALAPYMAPAERNGATLLARIENLDLGRASGGRGPGGGSIDSIEGVLIVGGPRGSLAAETPLRVTASYQPDAVDLPLFEEAYHGRVAALAEAFAGSAPPGAGDLNRRLSPGARGSETSVIDCLRCGRGIAGRDGWRGHGQDKAQVGGGPAVILVRPQLAVNIGMCARAMANFGLDDLRLVNPREGWPRSDEYRDVAYSAAAGATDLLDAARVFPSVEAAVGDLHAVYATTARERGQMKAVLTPSAAMAATAAAAGEKRGLLFGPERTGLDNDEVAIADWIVTFPSSPAYASLNLSQAVLICGYEWFKAAHGDAPPPSTIPRAVSPPAQREMLLAFFDFLEGKLDENGFFRPVTKKPGMRRNLRNILHRMELTQQDVRTLWGAVVRLVEGPRVEVKTRKRARAKRTEA